MEILALVYLVSAVVGVAMIICFFIMGSNIGRLRKIFDKESPNSHNIALNDYYKHLFWGENDKAVSCLKDAFWSDFKLMNREPAPTEIRLQNYEKLKGKYKNAFARQQMELPDWNGESYLQGY